MAQVWRVIGPSLCAALILCACSCDSGASHPTKEYILARETLAADSVEDFATLADAVSHNDRAGVLSLAAQGKAFMLDAQTRVLAGGITESVCGGTVESGQHISQRVVLACSQLGE
jgi:hypothetical protein